MVMSGQQEMYNHARDFREKVSNCIDSSEEVMNFYQALKSYNSVRNVDRLITDLLAIINTPKRHILFDEVGSLVAVDDYEEFMSKVPLPPSEGIRIVKIRRVATESLGFGIRGGKEHGVGVYISSVIRGSRADIAGLRPGDEILLVNGFMISESTHGEVVSLMRTRRHLRLKVRSARKYPERVNGNLTWKTLDGKENVFRYNPGVLNHLVSQLALARTQSPVLHMRETDKHVKFIVGPQGLGCRLADIFEKHLSVVRRAGVTPYIVFDGLPLPAKASEVEKRQRGREECLLKSEREGITPQEANKLRSQAVSISFNDISTCVNICLKEKVSYVVSPYESDAQMAFLLETNVADFAITEDSDLLAYGCKEVIVKLCLSGEGCYLSLTNILEGLKLNFEQFQSLCILAGCDYLKNVRGVGIHTAYKLICSKDDLFHTLEKRGAPADYKECFANAMSVFLHQTVFDVNAGKAVPLRKWESAAPAVELQLLCGKLLTDEFSQELAVGNIHTTTRMKVNSHSLHANDKQVRDDTLHSQQEASATTNAQDIREVHITTVERVSFPYVIPNFPVLTVDLIKVKFVLNGKECQGLINAKEHSNARPGIYMCTSHCDIMIDEMNYVVLWQLDSYKPFHEPVEHQPTQPRPSGRDDEETVHCLPFKVVGTCYSSSRQKALERAYDFLHVYNRPVFAKIVAEPDNHVDKNAIAVYVMTEDEYEKVGYIPRELTTYLHGPLKESALDVSVKHVRLCVRYLLAGYYITLNISKKGVWNNFVIQASFKVD